MCRAVYTVSLGFTAVANLRHLRRLLQLLMHQRALLMQVVAESRSDETFVALCLLTVTGASLITQKLGFSDTAGAFAAGAHTAPRPIACH